MGDLERIADLTLYRVTIRSHVPDETLLDCLFDIDVYAHALASKGHEQEAGQRAMARFLLTASHILPGETFSVQRVVPL